MASTRDVISPGVFAENALTTIPVTPIAGVSYRDPVNAPSQTPDGWPYAERVNSAEFNQLMFQYSTLLSILDRQGILGWSNLVDYSVPAVAFGSDGIMYVALDASGPATAVHDPVSSPEFWREFGAASQATETSAGIAEIATQGEVNTGTDDASFVTPLKLKSGFSASFGVNGHIRFPAWLLNFQVCWGRAASVSAGAGVPVTFTQAFSSATRVVFLQTLNATGSSSSAISQTTLVREDSITTSGFTAQTGGTATLSQFYLAIGN